jgi:hypothetical protein
MQIARTTACQKHEIYQPRWHDRKVIMFDFKIGVHNEVVFSKAPTLEGVWYISGAKAKSYPPVPFKTRAGKMITSREIPLDDFEPLERI